MRKYPPRLTDDLIKEYVDDGLWLNKTIIDYLKEHVKRAPLKEAIIDRGKRINYEQLWKRVNSLAVGLRKIGIEEGDVVSYQLPNWSETVELHLAVVKIGAINNPIIPIYRERELNYILNDANSKVIFIPTEFRNTNYPEMIRKIRHEVPNLEKVVTVGDREEGCLFFDDLINENLGMETTVDIDPNATSLLMYTSGTTSNPKGVEHTQNTLMSEVAYNVQKLHKLSSEDVVFMASPVTHITGLSCGTLWPIFLGGKVVYLDIWEARKALELIEKERCTITKGATPFLQQIVYFEDLDKYDLSSLKLFGCGGASVYSTLIYDAIKKGIPAARGYGSTEHPTISAADTLDPDEFRAERDGRVHEFNSVKIVDIDNPNIELPVGSIGEICSKGPELFLGYHRPELNLDAFDEDGYFYTGDIGRLNHDNTLEIIDRKKDIIIRKGENISAKELEDIIYEHPDVIENAVVGLKDEERGEKITAVIVLKEGAKLTLNELISFFDKKGVSKRKFPEQIEFVSELPKNSAGKVQKHKIKQILN